jgi:hypothetical protein
MYKSQTTTLTTENGHTFSRQSAPMTVTHYGTCAAVSISATVHDPTARVFTSVQQNLHLTEPHR